MRKTYQFSLFASASGKGLLFSPGVLTQYLDDQKTVVLPDELERARKIRNWLDSLGESDVAESTLEAGFLNDIMGDVLGFSLYPAAGKTASLFPKPPAKFSRIARTPDAGLGAFSDVEMRFTGVLELKTPGTDLDQPQPGYNNETPVEQGFYYGRRILGVRWVVVSDMRFIRLYSAESQVEYEEFDLARCVDDEGAPTSELRRLFFLLHADHLINAFESAPVALLYAKSNQRQLEIRDSFYEVYYEIRADLFEAITMASSAISPPPSRADLLEATQRLLDRLLFIFYCEDHPQALIPHDTVRRVTESARAMPGPSKWKVYENLKYLFREVDSGSPPASGVQVSGYNGELFKDHWIVDHIDLPDTLYDKVYYVENGRFLARRVQGVWGLHVFDFWRELNEHLLGHIFEQSLSDLDQLGSSGQKTAAEKLQERKSNGIFYTTYLLSDFLSDSALNSLLEEHAPVDGKSEKTLKSALEARLESLLELRILDPACGSGAFLVSAYRDIVEEYWRIRSLLETLGGKKQATTLFDQIAAHDQAGLLRASLYGADILPQAIEIAKLALWLRSARKGEKVADLGGNLVATDSLRGDTLFEKLNVPPGSFDLVLGNPPWGSEISDETRAAALKVLDVPDVGWDSWELFVLLGLRALREGGRLAVVLPDSLLYPDKARIREVLFRLTTIEKLHNLGPDWFGKQVRMGTLVLQARRGPLNEAGDILAALLSGKLREDAIQGRVPLTQVEAQRSRELPIRRSLASETRDIEVFRGVQDDTIMAAMESNALSLGSLCERGRGEEMNKAGLAWICPNCLEPTTPGEKKKGGGYAEKKCPSCGMELSASTVSSIHLVVTEKPVSGDFVPFLDGDDINRRYHVPTPSKWLNIGLSGWKYKSAELYRPPKILVRQAGVGIVATLDQSEARCPQSIYVYRIKQEHAESYGHEYVLAALLSRAMAYYVFKRFAEVDPAKAHAKLTHERLESLPIPTVDFSDSKQKDLHDRIVRNVQSLLTGAALLGGAEDRDIERSLRELWAITADDGAYVNQEFYDLPDSQIIRDLFPNGRPRPDLILVANA